ncbi:MAG: diadenylate cyclase CdaA [Terrimicrobiaceae bacterium]
MLKTFLEFIEATWTSGVEILIIALVLYFAYRNLHRTYGARILIGLALIFLTLTLVSQLLNLMVIGWLLRSLSVFLAIALVVIFQPELRRALTELGSHPFFGSAFEKKETIEAISETVFELSSKGLGALLAIEREISLRPITETGVALDSEYSKELVLTIFHPKTVLHDGGAIIRNDRIVSAACIFPLTQREDLDRNLGLRHRAALGVTEESDAVAIVVSEETGQISICHGGTLERNLKPDQFRKLLTSLLSNEPLHEDIPRRLEGQTRVPDPRERPLVSHSSESPVNPPSA